LTPLSFYVTGAGMVDFCKKVIILHEIYANKKNEI